MMSVAPSFWLSPQNRNICYQTLMQTGILGLLLIRAFGYFIHSVPLIIIMDIYSIATWSSILIIDPARLPEATTTYHRRCRAFYVTLIFSPILAFGITSTMWALSPLGIAQMTLHKSPGQWAELLFSSYMDAMLFYNVLQSALRRLGLPAVVAITLQAVTSSSIWFITQHSIAVFAMALMISLFNGWLVHRYRSLWPAWVTLIAWHLFSVY